MALLFKPSVALACWWSGVLSSSFVTESMLLVLALAKVAVDSGSTVAQFWFCYGTVPNQDQISSRLDF